MTPTLTLPHATLERMPNTVGLPMASGSVLKEHLRRTVPPALAAAIEAIGDQVRTEIHEPLLRAPRVEDLADSFVRLYPRYWRQHVSASLLVATALGVDPERIFALTVLGLDDVQNVLETRGPAILGEESTTAALLGLHAIRRAARGVVARGLVDVEPTTDVDQWLNHFIAYAMVSGAVLTGLNADRAHGRLENLRVLATWSRAYALLSYQLTRRLGLLPAADLPGPLPAGADEEDRALADADLDEYARKLDQDARLL